MIPPDCPDIFEPYVSFTPAKGTTVTTATLAVTIDFCDDRTLHAASRVIRLNGQVVTSSFSYVTRTQVGCGAAARAQGTVTLAVGANTVSAQIWDVAGNASYLPVGTATYTYTGGRAAPIVSLAPHNGDNRSGAAGDLVVTHTTPAYVSMDVPRSVTLVYNSGTARPMVQVEADYTDLTGTAHNRSIVLKRPNLQNVRVDFVNGYNEIFSSSPSSSATRVTAIGDASTWVSGAHNLTMEAWQHWPGDSRAATMPVRVLVHNRMDSPYGAGWGVAEYERISLQADGGMVLRRGDGTIMYFGPRPAGSTQWVSPPGEFSTLKSMTCQSDGTCYERTTPDGTRMRYDGQGRLIFVIDRLGFGTGFTFVDATSDRIHTINDAAGKAIEFGYEPANGTDWVQPGTLRWIRDGGRTSSFAVDRNGDLVHIVDPDGTYAMVASYTAHRMTCRRDRLANTAVAGACTADDERYNYTYDAFGKVASDTLPAFTMYNGSRARPVVQYRSRERDLFGGVNPLGVSSFPRVDGSAVRSQVTDPRGNVTRVAVDRFGGATRIEEPLGRITTLERNDAHGRVTRSVSPSGHRIGYTYVGPNLATEYDSTLGHLRKYFYSGTFNQLDSMLTPSGGAWYGWSNGKLVNVRTGTRTAPATVYKYFSSGPNLNRLESEHDGRGHGTRYDYYSTGSRNTHLILGDAGGGNIHYDQYGRDTLNWTRVSPNHRTQYDVLNRVRLSVNEAADTVRTEFERRRNRTIDPEGQVYLDSLNALGQVVWHRDPRGAHLRSYYDAAGNVQYTQNRRSQTVAFTYDALNQLSSRTADGATTTYSTDPLGRFTATANAASVDTIFFDIAGRSTREKTVRGGQQWEHTSMYGSVSGQREQLGLAGPGIANSSVRWRYTPDGQLDRLIGVANDTTRLYYDHDRLPESTVLPNGVVLGAAYPYTHTPFSQTTWANGVQSAALSSLYSHDFRGRIDDRIADPPASTPPSTPRNGRSFQYDQAGRLLSAIDYSQTGICEPEYTKLKVLGESDDTVPTTWDCSGVSRTTAGSYDYLYDRVGNPNDAGTWVDIGNRLMEWRVGQTPNIGMNYDTDGNLAYRERRNAAGQVSWYQSEITFNSLGQLAKAWSSHLGWVELTYDGWGRRIRRTVNNTTSQSYVYDGDNLAAELDASGNPRVEYAHYPGIDRPHSMRWNGQRYYFAQDAEGNVSALLNATGGVANVYRYTPFGDLTFVQDSTFPNALLFKAREHDRDGLRLIYMRTRWYDPASGRFISQDPIGLEGGINPYAFAGNDPVNSSDPFGTCPVGESAEIIIDEMDGTWEWTCNGKSVKTGSLGAVPLLPAVTVTATATAGQMLGGILMGMASDWRAMTIVTLPIGGIGGIGGGGAAVKAISGLTTKAAARQALGTLSVTQAQIAAARSAIARGTSRSLYELLHQGDGRLFVHIYREGRDGFQVMQSIISPGGSKFVTQYGVPVRGPIHVHPKF